MFSDCTTPPNWMPFFAGLFSGVEVPQTDIIAESADELKAQYLKAFYKSSLREEGICNDNVTELEQLISIPI